MVTLLTENSSIEVLFYSENSKNWSFCFPDQKYGRILELIFKNSWKIMKYISVINISWFLSIYVSFSLLKFFAFQFSCPGFHFPSSPVLPKNKYMGGVRYNFSSIFFLTGKVVLMHDFSYPDIIWKSEGVGRCEKCHLNISSCSVFPHWISFRQAFEGF